MEDQAAARYREALLETLTGVPANLPILLSGGMDSMTLLAGLLALGRKPVAYSYGLGNQLHSEDWIAAHAACEKYGLKHVTVIVPSDNEGLVEGTREAIRIGETTRKTAVQCLYALIPMLRQVQADGNAGAITGAGGIVSDNRASKILGADYETNREGLETKRRTDLLGGDPGSATEIMKQAAAKLGVPLREPYSENPLAEVGLSIPYPEINTPVLKGIGCRAFPTFFGESQPYDWWRTNSSLQVNGGVRDLHERLLDLPVNRRGSRAVIGVYNDLQSEDEHGEQLQLG